MEQIRQIRSPSLPWKVVVYVAVGIIFFAWLLNTPEGLLGKADSIGYAVCHRIDLRSFHLGERPLPLCARCSGMYLGAVLGLVYQAILSPRRSGMPSWRIGVILGLLAAAFALDGLNSYLHLFPGLPSLYEPNNTLRLVTGTGMGLVIALVLYPAFNQSVWRTTANQPALRGFRPWVGLIILALLLDAVVLTENPLLLYPLALVSAAGVLVLLSMIYAMVSLIVLRAENRFQQASQLVLPLAGGFGLALLQILLFDAIRFWLTGTWDGFHLG
jgi:uncharacterized membrane protein